VRAWVGAVLLAGATVVASAAGCVPDFVYGDGGTTSSTTGAGGDDDGTGGRITGRGGADTSDGTGAERPTVGPTVGPGPGPGPGPSGSTSTGTVDPESSAATSSGETGAGGGGGGTIAPDAAASSTATTTGGGHVSGVPCWDGGAQQAVTCGAGDACCYDVDYYSEHQCDAVGSCSEYAYELQCNEDADCNGKRCCYNTDFLDDLYSITCEDSCDDYAACSAQEQCPEGYACYYVFDPDSSHDEYDVYGVCWPD
jgi:hypothetical protein